MLTETPPRRTAVRLRLRQFAFAAIANHVGQSGAADCAELAYLRQQLAAVQGLHPRWGEALLATLQDPSPADVRLLNLAADLPLAPVEILAVALAAAVEDDPIIGRIMARVQAPSGGTRPTLGLLATVFAPLMKPGESALAELLNGMGVRTGLLAQVNESAPLPERAMAMPVPVCLALSGHSSEWMGAQVGLETPPVPLAPSTLAAATRQARALQTGTASALVLRSGSTAESRTIAATLARALGRRPVFVETDKLTGFGVWLTLQNLLPVFVASLGPAECWMVPKLPAYAGPVLVIAGRDGMVETLQGAAPVWTIAVPSPDERVELWQSTLKAASKTLVSELGRAHRHGAGRIAQLGRLASHHAALRQAKSRASAVPEKTDVTAAAWTMEGGGLDALAEPQRTAIPDEALVISSSLRTQLDLLELRCRAREGLADHLGVAAAARYRPGVRALFCGPSGTGKTLAAGWLATRLDLPLYRIDLASVTSKYIGETEKNLAQLFSQAEHADIILLFDEADALFGKRTEIRDSNDRFANAQTNYLLQRIETYDGIVLLTSNSHDRFDSAFARRLDFILEFPLPNPEERRALWMAHVGEHHTLAPARLNQIAALVDVSGGHIRNAVLTAATLARRRNSLLSHQDILIGLESELRKLGRQLPSELT